MSHLFLKIEDAVNGRLGSVYFMIDNTCLEVAGIQKIEAHDTIKERTMNTVGTVRTQTALSGVEGEGSLTIHYYAVSVFSNMMKKYRNQGRFAPFRIVVVNEDNGTGLGRRIISFNGCTLAGDVPLAALNATINDALTFDIRFKYEDYNVLEDFSGQPATGRE